MKLLSVASLRSTTFGSFSQKEYAKEGESKIAPHAKHKQVYFLKSLAPPLMAVILALSPVCSTPVSMAQNIDVQKGASLFRQACIGCHDTGGNIIQPGATLFTDDLLRNGVNTEEDIFSVTYFGKGRMPVTILRNIDSHLVRAGHRVSKFMIEFQGFGEKCSPRGQCTFGARLQEEDIKNLAGFVKLQADQGWPKLTSEE